MIGLGGTIVAIATGGTRVSRGLVRVSGADAHEIVARVVPGWSAERSVVRGLFMLRGHALPVSVVAFHGPRSFTGEDGCEIVTVGNGVVLERMVERLVECGARLAAPGEFAARAHLAGKLTLDEAESIAARISAERDAELDAADRVRSGAFGRRCGAWADEIADLLALVEAGIDFTDQEDVVAISASALGSRLDALTEAVGATLGPTGSDEVNHAIPVVALVGPPNAGKSTLFNTLLGRSRSVVSDTIGTTRDAIVEEIDLGDGAFVHLVDLPGFHENPQGASTQAEVEAQAAAVRAMGGADVLIACDPAGRFEGIATTAGSNSARTIRVRTKADLGMRAGDDSALSVCALDGFCIEALKRSVADAAERGTDGEALVPRHRRAVRVAVQALNDGRREVSASHGERLDEPELVAVSLRVALDELGAVAGRVTPDDVLGRVFSSFCVGK